MNERDALATFASRGMGTSERVQDLSASARKQAVAALSQPWAARYLPSGGARLCLQATANNKNGTLGRLQAACRYASSVIVRRDAPSDAGIAAAPASPPMGSRAGVPAGGHHGTPGQHVAHVPCPKLQLCFITLCQPPASLRAFASRNCYTGRSAS